MSFDPPFATLAYAVPVSDRRAVRTRRIVAAVAIGIATVGLCYGLFLATLLTGLVRSQFVVRWSVAAPQTLYYGVNAILDVLLVVGGVLIARPDARAGRWLVRVACVLRVVAIVAIGVVARQSYSANFGVADRAYLLVGNAINPLLLQATLFVLTTLVGGPSSEEAWRQGT